MVQYKREVRRRESWAGRMVRRLGLVKVDGLPLKGCRRGTAEFCKTTVLGFSGISSSEGVSEVWDTGRCISDDNQYGWSVGNWDGNDAWDECGEGCGVGGGGEGCG